MQRQRTKGTTIPLRARENIKGTSTPLKGCVCAKLKWGRQSSAIFCYLIIYIFLINNPDQKNSRKHKKGIMSKKSSKLANILRSGGITKIRRDDVSTMFEECQQTILPVMTTMTAAHSKQICMSKFTRFYYLP